MLLTSQSPYSCYKHINERRTALLRRYFLYQFWIFPTYSCKYIIISLSLMIIFYVLSFRLKKQNMDNLSFRDDVLRELVWKMLPTYVSLYKVICLKDNLLLIGFDFKPKIHIRLLCTHSNP